MNSSKISDVYRLSFDFSEIPVSWMTNNPFYQQKIEELYRSKSEALLQSFKVEYQAAITRLRANDRHGKLDGPDFMMARLCYFHAGFDFKRSDPVEKTLERIELAVRGGGRDVGPFILDDIRKRRFEWERYKQMLRGVIETAERKFDLTHTTTLEEISITRLTWAELWSNPSWTSLERHVQTHTDLPTLGHTASSSFGVAAVIHEQRELDLKDIPLVAELNGLEVECTLFVREMAQRALDAVAKEDYSARTRLFEPFAREEYKTTIGQVVNFLRGRLLAVPPERVPPVARQTVQIPPIREWFSGLEEWNGKEREQKREQEPPLSVVAKSLFYHYWTPMQEFSDQLEQALKLIGPIKTDLVGICATESQRQGLDNALRRLISAILEWQSATEHLNIVDSKEMLQAAHEIVRRIVRRHVEMDGEYKVDTVLETRNNTRIFLGVLKANADVMEREFPPLQTLTDSAFALWSRRQAVRTAAEEFIHYCESNIFGAGEFSSGLNNVHLMQKWTGSFETMVSPWEAPESIRSLNKDEFAQSKRKVTNVLNHIFLGNLNGFQESIRNSVRQLRPGSDEEQRRLPSDEKGIQRELARARGKLAHWIRGDGDPDGDHPMIDEKKDMPPPRPPKREARLMSDPGADYGVSCEIGGRYRDAIGKELIDRRIDNHDLKGRLGVYSRHIKEVAATVLNMWRDVATDVFLVTADDADTHPQGPPALSSKQTSVWLALLIYFDFLSSINAMRKEAGDFWVRSYMRYAEDIPPPPPPPAAPPPPANYPPLERAAAERRRRR